MSDSYVIPSLWSGESLTTAGENLVKYIEKRVRELRAADELEKPIFDKYLKYYAQVMKAPQLMTPVQWIRANEEDTDRLWLHYLQTLDPVAAERAQFVPTAAPATEPAKATESTVNEGKRTMLLSESTIQVNEANYWDVVYQHGHTPAVIEEIKRARDTGRPFNFEDGHTAAPENKSIDLGEAYTRFVHSADDLALLNYAVKHGQNIVIYNGSMMLESQFRKQAAILEQIARR